MENELSPEALAVLAGESPPDKELTLGDRDLAERVMWAYRKATQELIAVEERWVQDFTQLSEVREEQLNPLRAKVAHLKGRLTSWHQAVYEDQIARGVKPSTSIKMNGGTLTSNAGGLRAVVSDEDELAAWLIANGHGDAVTITRKVSLAEAKKLFVGDKAVTDDGELMPGIEAVRGDRTFNVKEDKS